MNRFYLPEDTILGDFVNFPADRSHQIARVLRLQMGEKVSVFDPNGIEYLVEPTTVDGKQSQGNDYFLGKNLH